jgi:hypothetical protein
METIGKLFDDEAEADLSVVFDQYKETIITNRSDYSVDK